MCYSNRRVRPRRRQNRLRLRSSQAPFLVWARSEPAVARTIRLPAAPRAGTPPLAPPASAGVKISARRSNALSTRRATHTATPRRAGQDGSQSGPRAPVLHRRAYLLCRTLAVHGGRIGDGEQARPAKGFGHLTKRERSVVCARLMG